MPTSSPALSKFIIGWASHLYYWVYPGVMVGVTAILAGYLASIFWPDTFNQAVNSPTLMIGFCIVFSFGVSYIAYSGINGSTGVNIAINVIQISALIVFSVIAIGYRVSHNKDGDPGLYFASSGKAVPYQVFQDNVQDTGEDGKPKVDKDGKPVYVQDTWADDAKTPKVDDKRAADLEAGRQDHRRGRSEVEGSPPAGKLRQQVRQVQHWPWAIRSRTMKKTRTASRCWARTARSSRWPL